jgi:hypothetical protein
MNAAIAMEARVTPRDWLRWPHRLWLMLASLGGAALIVALVVKGSHYYMLPLAERIKSPLHPALKPGGTIGRSIGLLGVAMFAVMYVYPLRKRWSALSGWGSTKNWLDYHIVLGLTAPVLITFHASFKLNGIAGAAYWIMIVVALSGIVGRYLYVSIPHRIDEAEMTLDELQQLSSELAVQLEGQGVIAATDLKPLFDLPSKEQVQAMSVWRALMMILGLDIRRTIYVTRLRWRTGTTSSDHAEFNRVLTATKKQARLTQNIVFLSKMRELFQLWHVIHRPFSLSFAALALLHIGVVTVLGFF